MHSGEKSDFKIECDTLTSEDIETLAYLISKRFEFNGVYGIPTGGIKIANALKKYINKGATYYLIVDDVLTTGTSMEESADKFKYREPIIGVVLFARNRHPISEWIYPMFSMSKWWG
jgi:orotate phosphoribosyltransferase